MLVGAANTSYLYVTFRLARPACGLDKSYP